MLNVRQIDSAGFVFDKWALINHIDETCAGKAVVLLIDELNIISNGQPLDPAASVFLKTEFLDKRGRYLVFTTHTPIDLETYASSTSFTSTMLVSPSTRTIKAVYQPLSTEIARLRQMSPDCEALTPAEVANYGGIPSLIYSAKQDGIGAIKGRFDQQEIVIDVTELDGALQLFISEVLTGKLLQCRAPRYFDMFSSIPQPKMVRWPICYMASILSLFPAIASIPFSNTIDVRLTTHATRVDSGVDWELIVQMAMMLRCVDASVNGSRGPFNIVGANVKPGVHCHVLPEDCTTLEGAHRLIAGLIASRTAPVLIIVTPSYATFPEFDGFVCYKNQANIFMTWGYQVKLGRAYPKRNIPDWLAGGWLIRGHTSSSRNLKAGWTYLNRKDILAFLGYSLEPLCPSEWPAVSEVDGFDEVSLNAGYC